MLADFAELQKKEDLARATIKIVIPAGCRAKREDPTESRVSFAAACSPNV
jgi:hypothetical protein